MRLLLYQPRIGCGFGYYLRLTGQLFSICKCKHLIFFSCTCPYLVSHLTHFVLTLKITVHVNSVSHLSQLGALHRNWFHRYTLSGTICIMKEILMTVTLVVEDPLWAFLYVLCKEGKSSSLFSFMWIPLSLAQQFPPQCQELPLALCGQHIAHSQLLLCSWWSWWAPTAGVAPHCYFTCRLSYVSLLATWTCCHPQRAAWARE